MKVHPFVEAEKVAGHSVNKLVACSRSRAPPSTHARAILRRSVLSPTPNCSNRSGPSTRSSRAPMDHRESTRNSDTAKSPAAGDG
jgi:hypothetical protein